MLSHSSLKRIAVVTYNPMPLWLIDPLRNARRGMRQLIADARIFSTSRAKTTVRFTQESTQSYLQPPPPGVTGETPTPLGMVLSLIPPSVITEVDDIPESVGSLDNFFRAGGVGNNPGLAFGSDLEQLFTDTSAQFKWLASLTSSSLATTLYAYIYQLANDKRVGASAKVVQQATFFESFPLRVIGYAAALSGLAALASQLPEFADVAEREAQQAFVYQDWLKTMPLPKMLGTSIISIDPKAFSEVYGDVDRVICLPVFDQIITPSTVPGANFILPGFLPYWKPIVMNVSSSAGHRFMDGSHQNSFASSFMSLGNVESVARAYAYYVFELVRAVTVEMSDAIVTLKSAATPYKELWTTGGAILKRVIDPRPQPYFSWSMPNEDAVISAMLFGHYNANYSFLPRVDNLAITEATAGRLSWDNVIQLATPFRYFEGKDERTVFAKVSDLHTRFLMPLPNERVDDEGMQAAVGLSGVQAIALGYKVDELVPDTVVVNPSTSPLFKFMMDSTDIENFQDAIVTYLSRAGAPDSKLKELKTQEGIIKWLRALSKEVGVASPGWVDVTVVLAKTGMSDAAIKEFWERQLSHKWQVLSPYHGTPYDPVPSYSLWGTYHALPGMLLRNTLASHIYRGKIADIVASSRITHHNAPALTPSMWTIIDESVKLGSPPRTYVNDQTIKIVNSIAADWTHLVLDDSVAKFEKRGEVLHVNMTNVENFIEAFDTTYKGARLNFSHLGSHATIVNGKNLPPRKAFNVYATSIMSQPCEGFISRPATVDKPKIVEVIIDSDFLQVGVTQLRKIIEAATNAAS